MEMGTGKNVDYLVEVANVVNDVTYMNDIYTPYIVTFTENTSGTDILYFL